VTDVISDQIAAFAASPERAALAPRVVHEAKRRLVDSLACALGAVDSPPAVVARELAAEAGGSFSATAIGLARPTTVELAAFANSIMVRYLDYNDMHFTARGGGGHPSDLIAAALAVGEAVGSSGSEVVEAIVLGYEINGALASGVWLRERGWDQGLNVVAAASMMAGRLLGLSEAELGHALALAVTPNVPVRQTRVGHLSMWKGAATAGAVRNGIFAAKLASKGMTGPPQPFEGSSGIFEQVTGPFELRLPVSSTELIIEDIHTKIRPAEYNAQGPLDLILDLRDDVRIEDIDTIDLETYRLTVHEIGSDAAKWDPRTRETADHSLPYLMAVALVDGVIDRDSCSPERVLDPALRPLMARIRIVDNPAFSAAFPAELNNRIIVGLRDGGTVERHSAFPRGHRRNPVTDDDLTTKFEEVVRRAPAPDREIAARLLDRLWSIDEVPDIGVVMQPLGAIGGAKPVAVGGR
jgi:2-methylcitrate dehydratase